MARGGGGTFRRHDARRKKKQQLRKDVESKIAAGTLDVPEPTRELIVDPYQASWTEPNKDITPVSLDKVEAEDYDLNPRATPYGDTKAGKRNALTPLDREKAMLNQIANAEIKEKNKEVYAGLTDEQKTIRAQNAELRKYGVSSAAFGNKLLTDNEFYQLEKRLVNDRYKEKTGNLKKLRETNPEEFVKVLKGLNETSQIQFLHRMYDDKELTKDQYLKAVVNLKQERKPETDYYIIDDQIYTVNETLGFPKWSTIDVFKGQDSVAGQSTTGFGLTRNEFSLESLGASRRASNPYGDPGFFDKLLANPVARIAASAITGGVSEGAIAIGRGIAGETLHAGDWLNIATAGFKLAGPELTATQTEAASKAAKAGEEAVTAAIDVSNAATTGTVGAVAPFGELGNVAPNLDAIYQAAYDASLASQGVSDIFMGIPFSELTEAANTLSGTSDSFGAVEAASTIADAFQEKDPQIIYNLFEDTTKDDTTIEDSFDSETLETISEIVDIIQTAISDEEGEEVPVTGVTPDMPETIVDLEQPELDIEPIVADPIEEAIPQPTLPEVVEEVVEQEEAAEAGGGGEPAPEPTAPTEPTEPYRACRAYSTGRARRRLWHRW